MTHLQKFRLPALIFAVCLSLFLVRGKALADFSSPDSSISDSGGSFAIDSGSAGYPNSVWITGSGNNDTIYASTTAYTIVSYFVVNGGLINGGDGYELFCDSGSAFPFGTGESDLANLNSVISIEGDFHCTGDLHVDTPDTTLVDWGFQIVPYDTRKMQNTGEMIQSTSTMPLLDTHFGIIAGYFLAFMTMIFIVWLFKGQKRI